MKEKYLVLKVKEIRELPAYLIDNLNEICATYNENRLVKGKKLNHYIVINTDEEYINEVTSIMSKNGHWDV